MALALYRSGETFYATGITAQGAIGWNREGDQWVSTLQTAAPQAESVGFGDLPAELREEILAFAARSDVMRPQSWN